MIFIVLDEGSLPCRMHEAERLITFADAVVAIAMTLLILPLMDAATDFGEDNKDASISAYFSENVTKLFSFAISFFVVAELWALDDNLTRYLGCFTPLMGFSQLLVDVWDRLYPCRILPDV